jgi:hypothetical protein
LALADLASLTLGVVGKTGVPAVGATLGFTLAAPAIHFAHGDRTTAVVSLLVRGTIVGIAAEFGGSWNPDNGSSCHDDACKKTIDDVLPGVIAALGGLVFVVIDDTVLSFDDAPVSPRRQTEAQRSSSWLSLAPTLAPTSGSASRGASMGLVGTF